LTNSFAGMPARVGNDIQAPNRLPAADVVGNWRKTRSISSSVRSSGDGFFQLSQPHFARVQAAVCQLHSFITCVIAYYGTTSWIGNALAKEAVR
jgi:hypothetical protein